MDHSLPQKRNRSRRTTLSASLLFLFTAGFIPLSLSAQTGAPAAETIVKRMEANQVFETSRFEARLTVTNAFGTTDNDFTTWQRRGGDTLIEITSGPDRGQKVLRQESNIYLFYPDADEVIWLRGTALKNSVMGSDFSYEDLTNDKTILDRYTAVLEGESSFEGRSCWQVTLTAKTKEETYAKQEISVDKETYVSLHSVLYSASGKALRDVSSSDIRAVSGKLVPFKTVMKDLLKKNSVTVMAVAKAEINIAIPDSYFNREELSW